MGRALSLQRTVPRAGPVLVVGCTEWCTRALQCTANLIIWRNFLKIFELRKLDMQLSTLKNILKSPLLRCNNVLITEFGGLAAIIKNGDYEYYLLNFNALNLFGNPFVSSPCFNIGLLRLGMAAKRPSAEINVTLTDFFILRLISILSKTLCNTNIQFL